MTLLDQFIGNWKRKFASSGKKVLLAVSGGIDSMTMCYIFLQAKIPFAVGHCNFQLRGKDALADEELVRTWCSQNDIAFHAVRFDTEKMSAEWRKGIQETARILRYEWLDEIRKENSYTAIATAHHANDNAETLLINLFKGTGISGLHGIREKNGKIIRPLLFATREEIAAYAASNNVPFREDQSNGSDKYLRNAVRLNILPVVAQSFPQVITQLNRSIDRFADAEILYRKAVEKEIKRISEPRGNDIYIPVRKLKHTAALETVFYELFRQYNFSSSQVPQIVQLTEAESGHFISSSSHKVIRDRDFLIITSLETHVTDLILIEGIPCTVTNGDMKLHFSFQKAPGTIPAANDIAFLDADKLTLPLVLRRWRQGDYFYPLGMGMKKKKLSKFFIDQKIPVHEKEKIWVLESDKRIVWVAGWRLDERFKIKPTTEKALKVERRMN